MFRFLVLSALVACAFGYSILPRFLSPRIVGGKDTTIEKHPYQVSVLNENETHVCGGVIVGSRKILTAAKCCEEEEPSKYLIQYGHTEKEEGDNIISVAKVIPHPDYDYPSESKDLCVYILSDDIPLNKKSAKLIELAEKEPKVGAKAVVTGWGDLKELGDGSYILQAVEVNIVDRKACGLAYDGWMNHHIDKFQLCAGVKEGGKDFCYDDYGGPLVIDDKLVGIVSWNQGCGRKGFPSVYANVAEFREWINKQH